MKILITGGSSGLGKAMVYKLAESEKNFIYFTYNNSEESSKKICLENKNVKRIKCDFTVREELDVFLVNLEKLDIDILINNYYSGKFLDKHFVKTNSSQYLDAYKNNILPVIDITKTLIKTFKIKKKGLIISISSQSITEPPIGTGLYSSVKSVIEQLSKVWNSENKKFGISSVVISPSFMRTNLTSEIDERVIEMYYENVSNIDEINNVSNEVDKIIKNHKTI